MRKRSRNDKYGVRSISSKRRREMKRQKLEDQNHMCRYCGNDMGYNQATFDHKIPVSHGGKNVMSNLVLCCRECNVQKSNLEL